MCRSPALAGTPLPSAGSVSTNRAGFGFQGKLEGCSCAVGTEDDEVVSTGFCDEGCKTFIPYAIFIFLSSMANGMYIIPVFMSQLRYFLSMFTDSQLGGPTNHH